ncbi:hypothetical protein D3C76_1110910 [compost metagenome]
MLRALPLPSQIVRSSWRHARGTPIGRCTLELALPYLQRGLSFFERQQTIAHVAGHSCFHQGIAEG